MQGLELQASSRRAHASIAGAILLPIGVLVLSACSQVPDYANPVEWYHSVIDSFDGEAPEQETVAAEAVPGADAPYPKLSAAPPPPSREATVAEMKSIAEGLIADREHARYTDEVIRRSGEAPEPVPVTAPAQPAAAQPAAVPLAPVPQSSPNPPSLGTTQSSIPAPPALAPPSLVQAAASATNAPFPTSLPSTESLVTRPFEKAPPASSAVAQPSSPAVETPSGELDIKQLFNRLFEASGPGANVPATPPVAPVGRLVVPMPADRAPVAAPEAPGAQAAVVAALPAPQSRELLGSGEPDGGAPARSGSAALVRFPEGSADLPAEARDTLRLVASLHHEKGGTIRVVGHASGRTSELSPERHKMAKFDVSLRRARVVADALIGLGVKPEAVSISAMSDNDPVYYESMPSGEAGNRRAEIFLEY